MISGSPFLKQDNKMISGSPLCHSRMQKYHIIVEDLKSPRSSRTFSLLWKSVMIENARGKTIGLTRRGSWISKDTPGRKETCVSGHKYQSDKILVNRKHFTLFVLNLEIFSRVYFRAPSTKLKNSVLVFAQFRANCWLKQLPTAFFKINSLKFFAHLLQNFKISVFIFAQWNFTDQ